MPVALEMKLNDTVSGSFSSEQTEIVEFRCRFITLENVEFTPWHTLLCAVCIELIIQHCYRQSMYISHEKKSESVLVKCTSTDYAGLIALSQKRSSRTTNTECTFLLMSPVSRHLILWKQDVIHFYLYFSTAKDQTATSGACAFVKLMLKLNQSSRNTSK